MSFNMVIPNECPSCGEFDRCYDGCACPSCYPALGIPLDEQLSAWRAFTPLMLKLTEAEITWSWMHSNGAWGWKFSVETHSIYGTYCEITQLHNDDFCVDHHYRTRPQTDLRPAEYEWVTICVSSSAQECVDAISRLDDEE